MFTKCSATFHRRDGMMIPTLVDGEDQIMTRWTLCGMAALCFFVTLPGRAEAQVTFSAPQARAVNFTPPAMSVTRSTVNFSGVNGTGNRAYTQAQFSPTRFTANASAINAFQAPTFQPAVMSGSHRGGGSARPAAAVPSTRATSRAQTSLDRFSAGIQALGR